MNEAEKQLKWIGRARRTGGDDVSISVNYDAQSHKGRYAGLTFRNDCHKKFAGDALYFEMAFYKNRLFFKKSDSLKGLLLQDNSKSPNRYARIQSEVADYFAHWEGDYKLQYDTFWELYYVERKDNE